MNLLWLVVTGGQAGTDQAAWEAAQRYNIDTAGFMPNGFLTEGPDGVGFESHSEFASRYDAVEHRSSHYADRRRDNLISCDGAIVFNVGPTLSPGTRGLLNDGSYNRRPVRLVTVPVGFPAPSELRTTSAPVPVAAWIARHEITRLMIGGNRASAQPRIYTWVVQYLDILFPLLGNTRP